MKTASYSFRLTWEDLDNIKYIQYYYAERCLTKTDVIRMVLRERRNVLEAVAGSDADSTLRDFLRDLEMENEEVVAEGMDSGAINPEPAPGPGEH